MTVRVAAMRNRSIVTTLTCASLVAMLIVWKINDWTRVRSGVVPALDALLRPWIAHGAVVGLTAASAIFLARLHYIDLGVAALCTVAALVIAYAIVAAGGLALLFIGLAGLHGPL